MQRRSARRLRFWLRVQHEAVKQGRAEYAHRRTNRADDVALRNVATSAAMLRFAHRVVRWNGRLALAEAKRKHVKSCVKEQLKRARGKVDLERRLIAVIRGRSTAKMDLER
eukprot:11972327-Alexandrium_andersonii.AAC.1